MKLPIVHLPGFFLCAACGSPVLGDLTGEHHCITEAKQTLEILDQDKDFYKPFARRPAVYKHCS